MTYRWEHGVLTIIDGTRRKFVAMKDARFYESLDEYFRDVEKKAETLPWKEDELTRVEVAY